MKLDILADCNLTEIKKGERIFGGSSLPMVASRFEDCRAGDCVARHLSAYRDIVQVDGHLCL